MARVIRGIKLYDLWSNAGAPVASASLGITIETLSGRPIAVMTFDENGKRLAGSWDSGYSEKSDMRAYPLPIAVSGGTITLLNDGWYQEFLEGGYSFKGCRVQRAWSSPLAMPLGNYVVEGVSNSIGELMLTLGAASESLASDVASAPLVVGDWENMTIESAKGSETPLFEGVSFYSPESISVSVGSSGYWRPTGYNVWLVPSVDSGIDTLDFPANSYARVKSGYNEGSIFKIPKGVKNVVDNEGKKAFLVAFDIDYGVYIDDENTEGLITEIPTEGSIIDVSVFEFFTSSIVFKAGEDSVLTNTKDEDGNTVFVEEISGHNTLPMSAKRYDPVPMNYPLNGGSNILEKLGETFLTHYNSDDGTYANTEALEPIVQDVGVAPIRDYSKDTYTIFSGSSLYAVQRYIDNPRTAAKGVLVDFELHYDEVTTHPLTVNIKVVAEWSSQEWSSFDHVETLIDTDVEFGRGNGVNLHTVELANFNKEYYSETYEGTSGAQLDERTRETLSAGGWTASSKFLGGVKTLEFTSGSLLESSPRRLYFIITQNASVATRLLLKEIGLYGDATEPPSDTTTITADVQGKTGTWVTLGGAIENIANLQNFYLFGSADIEVEENSTPVKTYITKQSDLLSSVALKTILREAWYIGGMSRDGTTWKARSVAGMIGEDVAVPDSHYFKVPEEDLKTDAFSYDSENVPNSGTLTYGAGGDFAGNTISISSVDSSGYDTFFVTGITDPTIAESLWNMAHLIWLKTKTVVEIRKDASKLVWIYTEQGAIDYLVNLFDWNGGKGFSRKVISASFEVVDIDSTGLFWDIGDACRAFIPTITNTGDYSGVITGVEYNPESNTAEISTRIGQINQDIPVLQEVGIVGGDTPKLTEVDVNATEDANLTEVGVV